MDVEEVCDNVENESILQFHLADHYRRRCLDIRGSMTCLREREVVVNVKSRNEMRPFVVLTNQGSEGWNNWKDVPVQVRKCFERIHPNVGHPSIQLMDVESL